ncbi:MAG: DNA-binding protein WhiA [Lactovum sp.]
MSFSSEVKKELTAMPATTGTMMALVRMNGSLNLGKELTLSIRFENSAIAQYIYRGFSELYEISANLQVHQKSNLSKNRVYTVCIEQEVEALLDELSLADSLLLDSGLPELIKNDQFLQADYLRGTFLSSGSITNLDRTSYQLAIRNNYQEHAEDLIALLKNYQLNARLIEKKGCFISYLTKAEEIGDFLTIIGAMKSKFRFEETKILHEMRGLANRQSNFQSANIDKTVAASQELIKVIKKLEAENELPTQLYDIARLRLEYPEATLTELGQLHEPPLSKSAVNHRLRKISSLRKI